MRRRNASRSHREIYGKGGFLLCHDDFVAKPAPRQLQPHISYLEGRNSTTELLPLNRVILAPIPMLVKSEDVVFWQFFNDFVIIILL